MKRIRFLGDHFFAGLLVLIPFWVITWIILSALRVLWRVHLFLPVGWQPESFLGQNQSFATLLNVLITIGLSFFLAVGVSFLGWASKQYLGAKALEVMGSLIQRIPVIRSIYSALDQLLKTVTAGGGQQFNRVVYVEYPRKGVWALGFVTGPVQSSAIPDHYLNIYVPTTPNPTSGFHLMVSESEVRESHLTVEEAFKTILSLGIAQTSEVHLNRKN